MERVYFRIQAEFICELIRTQYWTENKPYNDAVQSLLDSFSGLTEEDAKQILLGKKILKGLYPDEEITIEEDNKHQEYLNNRKYIDLDERVYEHKPLSDYEEFLMALKNPIPSHYCRFNNHEQDNSFLSYKKEELFKNLKKNNLKLLGICLEPEYSKENRTGILVESQIDFNKYWVHFMDRNELYFLFEE